MNLIINKKRNHWKIRQGVSRTWYIRAVVFLILTCVHSSLSCQRLQARKGHSVLVIASPFEINLCQHSKGSRNSSRANKFWSAGARCRVYKMENEKSNVLFQGDVSPRGQQKRWETTEKLERQFSSSVTCCFLYILRIQVHRGAAVPIQAKLFQQDNRNAHLKNYGLT